jgi:translocation and assembly module TamB
LNFVAELSGAPAQGVVEAKILGGVDGPSAGVAALDGLLGQRLSVGGKVATLPNGGFAIDKLEAKGDHLLLTVDGGATQAAADVTASIALPDLKRADARVAGRADIQAKLTGSLAKPVANFVVNLKDASANGRPIPKLALTAETHDLTGALSARADLDGVIDNKKATGHVSAARAGAGWKVDDVDVAIGRASVKGNVALSGAGVASGRLVVSAPDLDDFSALALQTLAGRLNADVTFEDAGGAQNAALLADATGIKAPGAAIDKASAKFSVRDLYRRPMFDGDVSVDGAHVGKETISKVRFNARPAGAGAAALDLALDARGYNLLGRATLTQGERMRLDLAQFSAQRGDKKIALASPATVTLGKGAVELKGLSVALGSGRLNIDGTVGDRLDLTARASAVPLSVAALADPSLALEGTLDAEARFAGSKSAPAGDWKVKIAKAMAPQLRANGLPAVDASASGRLAGQRTSLDANIALGSSSKLKITGSAPLGAGDLALAIKGVVDAAVANTTLATNGQTVAGKANLDLRISGAATNPLIGGSITLSEGAFQDPLNGIALSKITGRIEGRGRDLDIASLTAQTKNGGQLAITGHVTVNPEAGMPGSIHIGAHHAQLADSDVVSSVGDLDVTLSGALAKSPKVSGKVTLASMDVNVPDRMPANLKPLPNGAHIDAKGFAAQMLALEMKAKANAAKHSSFDAALDLAISAPTRIFVRGRGIDAEFGGELKIVGTIQKPNVLGGFDLRRGKLQLLTQRIDLSRGKLTFLGGFMPQLDFTASTTAGDVTATIGIQGPASLPTFTFTSTPELPQDEVLSRLLFAKASGSLTPFQAVQLATALAQFSGAASGVDAFEKMRKALGVDSLDLDASGSSGPTIGASRYIMDGVNVGVKTGAKPEESAVSVGVDLTKGVRATGETRADGKTSLGIGMEWEY